MYHYHPIIVTSIEYGDRFGIGMAPILCICTKLVQYNASCTALFNMVWSILIVSPFNFHRPTYENPIFLALRPCKTKLRSCGPSLPLTGLRAITTFFFSPPPFALSTVFAELVILKSPPIGRGPLNSLLNPIN